MRFRNIDSVTTTRPFPCAVCRDENGAQRIHLPGRVIRITGAWADFPYKLPEIDLIFCEESVDHMGFLLWAEHVDSSPEAQARVIEYTPDELMALDRERDEEDYRRSIGLTD